MSTKFTDNIKHTILEGGLTRTKKVLSAEEIATCLITTYQNMSELSDEERKATSKVYDEQLKELEDIIDQLGYGSKKIIGGFRYKNGKVANEPGLRISFRPIFDEEIPDFIEEMLKLGEKYNQESILLKLPNQKAAYYITKPGKDFGKKTTEFNNLNYITTSNFNTGYTQIKKDALKSKPQAIEFSNNIEENTNLLEYTDEDLTQIKAKPYTMYRNTLRHYKRKELGLK